MMCCIYKLILSKMPYNWTRALLLNWFWLLIQSFFFGTENCRKYFVTIYTWNELTIKTLNYTGSVSLAVLHINIFNSQWCSIKWNLNYRICVSDLY